MKQDTVGRITQICIVLVLVTSLLNVFLVIRNVQQQRTVINQEEPLRAAVDQQQRMEAVVREFLSRAGNDTNVINILHRHQLIKATPAETNP